MRFDRHPMYDVLFLVFKKCNSYTTWGRCINLSLWRRNWWFVAVRCLVDVFERLVRWQICRRHPGWGDDDAELRRRCDHAGSDFFCNKRQNKEHTGIHMNPISTLPRAKWHLRAIFNCENEVLNASAVLAPSTHNRIIVGNRRGAS